VEVKEMRRWGVVEVKELGSCGGKGDKGVVEVK